MNDSLTVPLSLLKPFFHYLSQKGLSTDEVLSRAGIDSYLQETSDNRASLEVMDRIYRQAMLLTGDDHLGLHVGEFVRPGTFNIVGHIFMNCRTTGEVVEKLIQYSEIVSQGVRIDVSTKMDGRFVLEYDVLHPDASLMRQHVECMFSGSLALARSLTGSEINPLKVCFRHQAPPDIGEHERIFKAPIRFESTMNALIFPKGGDAIPIMQSNPELLAVFEQHACRILREINEDKPYAKKVGQLLLHVLKDQIPTMETVASELGMSVRNLQRKLEQENTSFREVFNTVYRELAISYLINENLSVAEIAYLLGFSEPSAFHRSFKRWTGLTPRAYREKHSSGINRQGTTDRKGFGSS